MSEDNEDIWLALDDYFERAGDNRFENLHLADSQINRLGNAFILRGNSWIAWRLEKEGSDSALMALMGASNKLVTLAKKGLSHWGDLVSTLGENAGPFLVSNSYMSFVNGNEDESALAAILLANCFNDKFAIEAKLFSCNLLKGIYPDIVGTSCRMAIAWALYSLDEKHEFESLVESNIVWQKELRNELECLEKGFDPQISREEMKWRIYRELALGEGRAIEMLSKEIKRKGIIDFVAINIAGDAMVMALLPNWKKKRM